jgi:transposase-like protein
MSERKKYTLEFKAAAVARVEAGEKPVDIQKELGLSNSMVSKWAREFKEHPAKWPKLNTGTSKYSPEVKAKAIARVRAGEKAAAVGRDMKLGNGMVSYWLKHDTAVAAGTINGNGHRTNGPGQASNGNGNGAVLDAIVFLKKAKKAIHNRAARGEGGLEDPVALLSMLALQTLMGGLE